MKINNINSSYSQSFSSKKLFSATLLKKASNGIKEPVRAFISELQAEDIGRKDLCISRWKRTLFAEDILEDFKAWYTPASSEKLCIPEYCGKHRFFAVETPSPKGTKTIAMAEIKVLDDFIVLDRLQTLIKSKRAKNHLAGAGSSLVYTIAQLAQQMKKKFIVLETHKNSVGFYKKIGFKKQENSSFNFYRLFQDKYSDFLDRTGSKLNIEKV